MPDRIRARAVLAALLIAITIVGIRTAGPSGGWVPPTFHVVIAIGIVLEAVLAGLFVVLRRRRAPNETGEPALAAGPASLAARLRLILSRTLVAGLIVIPVAILLAAIRKPKLHPVRVNPGHVPPLGKPRVRVSPYTGTSHEVSLLAVAQYLLIAALLVTIALLFVAAWRRRTTRVPRSDEPIIVAANTPAELARAVASGRRALRLLDNARAAIIACYVAMERSLAKAGASRAAAETPDELLARAVSQHLVSAEPAGVLTALFYEARFSSHPMPDSKRDQAERALIELAATLPDQASGTPAAPAGGPAR